MAKALCTPHIVAVPDIDPRSQATFEIVSRDDGSFAVVVQIPEAAPVTVTTFATTKDADRWIASYKDRVAEGHPRKHWRSGQGNGRAKTPS